MDYYFGKSLSDIKNIKVKADGHLDMLSLPVEARKLIQMPLRDKNGQVILDTEKKPIIVEENVRDLGMMVSIITKAIQELDARLDKLEATSGERI